MTSKSIYTNPALYQFLHRNNGTYAEQEMAGFLHATQYANKYESGKHRVGADGKPVIAFYEPFTMWNDERPYHERYFSNESEIITQPDIDLTNINERAKAALEQAFAHVTAPVVAFSGSLLNAIEPEVTGRLDKWSVRMVADAIVAFWRATGGKKTLVFSMTNELTQDGSRTVFLNEDETEEVRYTVKNLEEPFPDYSRTRDITHVDYSHDHDGVIDYYFLNIHLFNNDVFCQLYDILNWELGEHDGIDLIHAVPNEPVCFYTNNVIHDFGNAYEYVTHLIINPA